MTRLRACVAATELASVTRTVKLLVPVAVGVPEITPVPAASDNPAGKVPEAMDQLYGVVPLVAVSVVLYAEFCVPPGKDIVVIVGGGVEVMVRLRAFWADKELASVTCTVKLLVPP